MRVSKKISILLVLVLLMTSISTTVFANESANNQILEDQQNLIDELFDERAELICKEQYDKLDEIDQTLSELGVTKLSHEEVAERFFDESDASPYVTKPADGNIHWYLYSTTLPWEHDGHTYEVHTLIAQATDQDSSLKEKSSVSVELSSPSVIKAGTTNALKTLATDLAGKHIPGASIALTVYDTLKNFMTDISPSTEISGASIIYSYSHVTTAAYKYVRPYGGSEYEEELSLSSTKGVTAIGYQYPSFSYGNGTVMPEIKQGEVTVEIIPTYYNHNRKAIEQYVNNMGSMYVDFVSRIEVIGLNGQKAFTITPTCPWFPPQI